MRHLTLATGLFLLTASCGGASSEPVQTAPTQAAPAPRPVQAEAPAANPHEGTLWYVYWEGIHCLTIYPTPGLVRSEESRNANATFSSRNPHFSVISSYYEREQDWSAAIDAATSVDDLILRLGAMEGVEVEEADSPVQSY